ncbi:alpha/beta fold hydrolase [Variovorax terrae]|uniref:Alpha/beta hydrolase n=1 Tax=Variovorax terrae TaxID=2923278 RepID=A0A9X1VWM5_9BURK|nr:alpha/beta fold hydrolase [Variovorax terrae]MCJ0764787.1 alpha/beta hydrolase [Variovorax terrae]
MKPVLLLIPGMLNTAEVWAGVAEHLGDAAELRIATVQTQDSIAQMARDAWALLADVPAGVPLVLCGFSMGGYVALEMMASPDRPVSALALLDTSARPESAEGAAMREKTIAAIGRDFSKVVDGVAQFATHAASREDAALMARLREVMLGIGSEAAIRQNRAILGRADHRARLAQLNVPTLVMCGRDDKVTPPALSQELAALIPGARLEWIENAGHMAPMEQPARVAALLATLL